MIFSPTRLTQQIPVSSVCQRKLVMLADSAV